MQDVAKRLDIGPIILFRKLRAMGILDTSNIPYPDQIKERRFVVERKTWIHEVKGEQESRRTKVTQSGADYIENILNENKKTNGE